ncbi:hypothetical protein K458DRAFT_488998 [Lentithecium fluviatile CBS 122367]|uniref:Uncharacterized protein n=1 Tax=Lentithecium fluviatile CBS 122367 TaxID=1168545 RepID=A0A6G1IUH8_9PLEO|nr:hypothetical protein K458DRAFT_488998 [Lentithecium fluviatile CBS 122367]
MNPPTNIDGEPEARLREQKTRYEAQIADLKTEHTQRLRELQDRNHDMSQAYDAMWAAVRMEVGSLVDGFEGLRRVLRQVIHENQAFKEANEALKRDNEALANENDILEEKWRDAEDRSICTHEQWSVSFTALMDKVFALKRENERMKEIITDLDGAEHIEIRDSENETPTQTRISSSSEHDAAERRIRAELNALRDRCARLERHRYREAREDALSHEYPQRVKELTILSDALKEEVRVLTAETVKLNAGTALSEPQNGNAVVRIQSKELRARIARLRAQKKRLRRHWFETATQIHQMWRKPHKGFEQSVEPLEGAGPEERLGGCNPAGAEEGPAATRDVGVQTDFGYGSPGEAYRSDISSEDEEEIDAVSGGDFVSRLEMQMEMSVGGETLVCSETESEIERDAEWDWV